MATTSRVPFPNSLPNLQAFDGAGGIAGSAERGANPKALKNQKKSPNLESRLPALGLDKRWKSGVRSQESDCHSPSDMHFGSLGGSLFLSMDAFIVGYLLSNYDGQ